jgi:apolipoprotein N-acyltransferase
VAVLLVAVLFYTGWRRMQGAPPAELTVEVLAVQPSLPQDPWGPGITAGAALEELLLLSRTGMMGGGVDLVVWPETPVGEELRGQPAVRELVEGGGVALLFGSNLWESGRVYNAALFQEPGREAQVYRKSHLVMMGEYVPLRDMLPWLRKFVPVGQDFSAGREHAVLRDATGMLRMAPLICFEDTFGRVARRFVPGNPNLLVNLTNDGWFGRSAQSRQHLANAQFRAVELGIPLLRVANTGVTAVVDQYGRVQARLGSAGDGSLWGRGFLRHTVGLPAPGGGTFYARHGDWPGPLCLAATVLLVWWERRSKAA